MPDPRSVIRLAALAVFLLLVALGLWLLDAGWAVIAAVMAAAWLVAAVVEWAAWRQERVGPRADRLSAPASAEPAPPAVEEAYSSSVLLPPEPEPEEEPAARMPKPVDVLPEESTPEPEAPEPEPPPATPPLRPVPSPPPEPPRRPAPPPAAARAPRPAQPPGVVDMRRRATAQARRWNLWDLERLARDELHGDPSRYQELSYLFVHLRQFASPDGSLPTEFDPLVRESLGDLLEQRG